MLSKIIYILAIFFGISGVASANGDIYIALSDGGEAEIFINGVSSGETTPTTLRNIPAGDHEIAVTGDCLDVSQIVTVADDRVSRVELTPSSSGGFFELSVSPENARVFLDEQPVGVGPYLAMEVTCGEHEVTVSALQHQTKTESFNLSMGEALRLEVSLLQSGTGSVSVLVTPIEATILLDGSRVGEGPVTLDSVSGGEHRIGAMLDGFAPIDQPIRVSAGEVTQVELSLIADAIPNQIQEPTESLDQVVTQEVTDQSQQRELPTEPLSIASGLDWRDYTAAAMVTTSLVTGYLSWKNWSDVTMVRYNKYVTEDRDVDYYNNQVMPAWGVSIGLAAVSGVSLLSGSYFLFYDDNGANTVGVSGRF